MSLHESATVTIHPASLEPEDTTENATALQTHHPRERANAAAIELALRLEASQHVPTALERSVLLGYTGVGGTTASSEAEDGNTLGLLNEYYTPSPVARAIWAIIKRLGFEGGHALEPASGIGVFLETAPPTVRFTAVELNPDAARINRLLHPQASVRVMPFEHDQRQTDELEYDLVIGNPPFGPRGMNALEDKPHRKDYPRYFLDAALDRLRDGGLLAFVIPSGWLDGCHQASRLSRLPARPRPDSRPGAFAGEHLRFHRRSRGHRHPGAREASVGRG